MTTTTATPLRPTPQTNPAGYWDGEYYRYDVDYYTVANTDEWLIDGKKVKCTGIISPLFATVEQARDFRQSVIEQYPDCRVVLNTWYHSDPNEDGRKEFLAKIIWPKSKCNLIASSDHLGHDEYLLQLTTNAFSPRAKDGEYLLMKRGVAAEIGDIVATGDDCHLEQYKEGMEYIAAEAARIFRTPDWLES